MSKLKCEISFGELLDKISILEIKKHKIKNKDKLKHINNEYKILLEIKKKKVKNKKIISKLYSELKNTNLRLWSIEDKIRVCEKNKKFNKKFISLARNVYFTNDKRSKIKHKINHILNSKIFEVKDYSKYS